MDEGEVWKRSERVSGVMREGRGEEPACGGERVQCSLEDREGGVVRSLERRLGWMKRGRR